MNDPIRDYVERNVPDNNIRLYLKTGLTDEYWRMHYAGLAMQGILTQEKSVDENGDDIFITYEWVAITAFKIADAMLKQNKEPL